MAQLLAIYDKFASTAMQVAYDGANYQAKDLHELKDWVEAGECPVRLLLPVDPQSEGREGNFIALGDKSARITWRIVDVLLAAPVGTESGLDDYAEDLMAYCDAYVAALQGIRSSMPTQCTIENWRVAPSPEINYPRGSGRFYLGVIATIDVTEFYT